MGPDPRKTAIFKTYGKLSKNLAVSQLRSFSAGPEAYQAKRLGVGVNCFVKPFAKNTLTNHRPDQLKPAAGAQGRLEKVPGGFQQSFDCQNLLPLPRSAKAVPALVYR
jgi:hypothetical protein